MAIRILHTADIHLGAPMTSFGDLAAQRTELLRKTFLNVCKLGVKEEVDLFICAGDMFDSLRPSQADIECARNGFDKLARADIPAVAIPGGHDGAGVFQNVLETFKIPGLEILSPSNSPGGVHSVESEKGMINLYSVRPKPGIEQSLDLMERRDLEGFHVGVLHGSVFDGGKLDAPYKDLPVTTAELAALNLDYIALGHYHQFQVIEKDDKTIGCYPGTIESKRFAETGPRYAALVTLADKGLHIEKVDVGQTLVEKHELDVELLPDEESIIEKIISLGGKKKLARITLKGLTSTMLNSEQIQQEAAGAFEYLQLFDETKIAGNADVRSIAGEPTVRGLAVGHLLRALDASDDPADQKRINLALRLLMHEFELHREGRKL